MTVNRLLFRVGMLVLACLFIAAVIPRTHAWASSVDVDVGDGNTMVAIGPGVGDGVGYLNEVNIMSMTQNVEINATKISTFVSVSGAESGLVASAEVAYDAKMPNVNFGEVSGSVVIEVRTVNGAGAPDAGVHAIGYVDTVDAGAYRLHTWSTMDFYLDEYNGAEASKSEGLALVNETYDGATVERQALFVATYAMDEATVATTAADWDVPFHLLL